MALPPLPDIELGGDELFFLLLVICYHFAYRATVWVFYRQGILDEYAPDDVEREEWIRIAIIAAFAAVLGAIVLSEFIAFVV